MIDFGYVLDGVQGSLAPLTLALAAGYFVHLIRHHVVNEKTS